MAGTVVAVDFLDKVRVAAELSDFLGTIRLLDLDTAVLHLGHTKA